MTTCLVVFGREPIPGRVKTRLANGIGPKAAVQVYEALLEHTLETAKTSGARVVLSLAEEPSTSWGRNLPAPVEVQRGTDLGDRMRHAFAHRFSEGEGRVVIVGSDCPWFLATHIAKASAELDRVDAVLGPSADGGYWLVAQRPPGLEMFTGIPWSSPETLDATRKRMKALGGTWSELDELVDIDSAEDLELILEHPRTPEQLRRRLLSALER